MTNTGTWLPRVGEIWMPNGDKYVVNKIMYGAFEPSISLVAAADGAKSVWDIDSMLIWFRKVG